MSHKGNCSIVFILISTAFAYGFVPFNWTDIDSWQVKHYNDLCRLDISFDNDELKVDYNIDGGGWSDMRLTCPKLPTVDTPIVFTIKADSDSFLEMKFVDTDGSEFMRKIDLRDKYKKWTKLVLPFNAVEYFNCGNNKTFDGLKSFSLTFSGGTKGTVWLKDIGFGKSTDKSSFSLAGAIIDPNSELAGFGFAQRRHRQMQPKDVLVLEYLKQLQDVGSAEKQLLPSMGPDNLEAQTFNNALVAMAFMIEGEKQRAECILDFYASATDKSNTDLTLQNFYYNGEARGFFQWVVIRDCDNDSGAKLHHEKDCTAKAYHHTGSSDRWMGDMVWLMYAYKLYEKKYDSHRYNEITDLIKNLLVSWYKPDPTGGGYIQSGWRKGDTTLHEEHGHHEGNIDCYALFKLTGDLELARNIRVWVDNQLEDKSNLPLDLYTWRVLSFGENVELLNVPDYDLRYRKTIIVNGKKTMGFYHGPDIDAQNIWLDGTGHIACAYIAYGDKYRGYFYADQMDNFLIDKVVNGVKTRTLPYTANKTSGYDWVEPDRGFISVCAWYLFAKNKFNPMSLDSY